MQLNIYLISHPIIKKLSTQIIYARSKVNPIYSYQYNQLNILLIYEVTRKWIELHNLYIKSIDFTKEIYIFDEKESYLIMTNLMSCESIISAVKLILPKVFIQHIDLNKNKIKLINDDCLDNQIVTIIEKQKIIIIEKFLNNYSIIKLLDYLLLKKNIKINQIKIICITCNNSTLEKVGHKYPYLSIYTTKIYNY